MGDLTAAGQWDRSWSLSHINVLEMEAVAKALSQFKEAVRDKHIRLNTDNTTVACYLNKQGGSHSASLSRQAERILLWCQDQNVILTARYVPGKLNVLADSLSRSHMILPSEWTLSHNVLQPIWATWFKPQIDLFATRFSKRLPLFVSPVPDPQAWAVDAFSIPWRNLVAYAFPPFPIIGKVLKKAREEDVSMILVAPLWEAQPWYPDLLLLTHVNPLPLALGAKSLVQPRTGVPHGNPSHLRLHAWMLCGTRCQHKARPRN